MKTLVKILITVSVLAGVSCRTDVGIKPPREKTTAFDESSSDSQSDDGDGQDEAVDGKADDNTQTDTDKDKPNPNTQTNNDTAKPNPVPNPQMNTDPAKPSTVPPEIFASTDNALGGMTGGGGGTVLGDPVGQADAAKTIALVKSHLQLFFNQLSYPADENVYVDSLIKTNKHIMMGISYSEMEYLQKSPLPDRQVFVSIFGTDFGKIAKTIRALPIKDAASSPCYYGVHETDGSYHPEHGICLSSHRLGSKLTRADLYSQTMALAVHELVHVYGASEADAIRVQKAALEHFAIVSPKAANDLLIQASRKLEEIHWQLSSVSFQPTKYFPYDANQVHDLSATISTEAEGMSLFSKEQMRTYFGLRTQLNALKTAGYEWNHLFEKGSPTVDRTASIFESKREIICDRYLNTYLDPKIRTENSVTNNDCRLIAVINSDLSFADSFNESISNILGMVTTLQNFVKK